MKKAAVVIDAWKLDIFTAALDNAGFVYEQFDGPADECITLKVQTPSVADLAPVVRQANDEAARSKLN